MRYARRRAAGRAKSGRRAGRAKSRAQSGAGKEQAQCEAGAEPGRGGWRLFGMFGGNPLYFGQGEAGGVSNIRKRYLLPQKIPGRLPESFL